MTRETHETPARLCEAVMRAGGINPLGEPNFRVIWGGSRLTWIGGKWTDRDENGNVLREVVELRRVPKYVPVNRWHIERWMPPEAYGSPETWLERTVEVDGGVRIPALGPYPSRGEYEHCFTLSGPNDEFLPLNAATCDWVVRAVEWSRRQSRNATQASLQRREERNAREWDSHADEILDDALECAG